MGGTTITNVNTNEFWELMKSARFIRTGPKSGMINGKLYYVESPPESVPGFIKQKIEKTLKSFGFEIVSHDFPERPDMRKEKQ